MSYMHDHVKKNHSVGTSVNEQKPKYLTLLFYFFLLESRFPLEYVKQACLSIQAIYSPRERESKSHLIY